MSDITIGAGALIVGGGMVFVIFSMSFFTGTEVGLQGFKGLEQIGAENFTGLIGAFANTREVTPLIAGVAFAAQVGAGFTAELGAMRISEEIDALEVMSRAVEGLPGRHPGGRGPDRHRPALPDLALRQLLRHQARVAPSSSACRPASTTTTSASTSRSIDVVYSLAKACLFAIVVALIHCYYGYYATGGPAGRGRGRRAGHPPVDRVRRGAQPRAVPDLLGWRQHREPHRVDRCALTSRRRRTSCTGAIALLLLMSAITVGVKAAFGAFDGGYRWWAASTPPGRGSSPAPT